MKVPPILLSMTTSSRLLDGFDLSPVTEVFSGAAPPSAQAALTLQLLFPSWKIRQACGAFSLEVYQKMEI